MKFSKQTLFSLCLALCFAVTGLSSQAAAASKERGLSNGQPFQTLMKSIDQTIIDVQAQIDALSDDVEANAEEINMLKGELEVLQDALAQGCPAGFAIRSIDEDGGITCESDNEATTINRVQVCRLASGHTRGCVVTCPAGFRASGGGFINPRRDLWEVTQSRPSGTRWVVVFTRITNGSHAPHIFADGRTYASCVLI